MSGRANSEKALQDATKQRVEDAYKQAEAVIVRIEGDVKKALKKGTYGTLPTSYHGFATEYGIPSTVKKNKGRDSLYFALYNRVEDCVRKVRKPPLPAETVDEFKGEIKRLETQVASLGASNANLADQVVQLRDALEAERLLNSNKARKAARKAAENNGNKVVGIGGGKKQP